MDILGMLVGGFIIGFILYAIGIIIFAGYKEYKHMKDAQARGLTPEEYVEEAKARRNLKNKIHQPEEEEAEELPDNKIAITLEQLENENGTILCFDQDNNFLCQGKTTTEVQDNFRTRFPGITAVIIDQASKELFVKLTIHETEDKIKASS